jgi:hypothetical protein
MTLEERKLLVEEMLRWTTVTMHFRRTLTQDVELRGKNLKAGDKVVLWYASANYDDDHFESPEEFRPTARPTTTWPLACTAPTCASGRISPDWKFECSSKRSPLAGAAWSS